MATKKAKELTTAKTGLRSYRQNRDLKNNWSTWSPDLRALSAKGSTQKEVDDRCIRVAFVLRECENTAERTKVIRLAKKLLATLEG